MIQDNFRTNEGFSSEVLQIGYKHTTVNILYFLLYDKFAAKVLSKVMGKNFTFCAASK